jgi:hypothetical protein
MFGYVRLGVDSQHQTSQSLFEVTFHITEEQRTVFLAIHIIRMKGITGAKNSEFCFSTSKKNEFFFQVKSFWHENEEELLQSR